MHKYMDFLHRNKLGNDISVAPYHSVCRTLEIREYNRREM